MVNLIPASILAIPPVSVAISLLVQLGISRLRSSDCLLVADPQGVEDLEALVALLPNSSLASPDLKTRLEERWQTHDHHSVETTSFGLPKDEAASLTDIQLIAYVFFMICLLFCCIVARKLLPCPNGSSNERLVKWYRFSECCIFNGCATSTQFWQFTATQAVLQGALYAGLNYSKYGFIFLHLSQVYFIILNTASLAYLHLASEGSQLVSWIYWAFAGLNFHWNSYGKADFPPEIMPGVAALLVLLTWAVMMYLRFKDLNRQLVEQKQLTKFVFHEHLQPNTATSIAIDTTDRIGPYIFKSISLGGCGRKVAQQLSILGRFPAGSEETFLGVFQAYFQPEKTPANLVIQIVEAHAVKPSDNFKVLSQMKSLPFAKVLDAFGLQNMSESSLKEGSTPKFGSVLSSFSSTSPMIEAAQQIQMILTSSVSQRKVSLGLTIDPIGKTFMLRVDEIDNEAPLPQFLGTSSSDKLSAKKEVQIEVDGGSSSDGNDKVMFLLNNRYTFVKTDPQLQAAAERGDLDEQASSFSDRVEREYQRKHFDRRSSAKSERKPINKLSQLGQSARSMMTERKPWHEQIDDFDPIVEEDEGKGTSSSNTEGILLQKQDTSKRRSAFAERATHTLDERKIETLSNDTLAPPTCDDQDKILKPESNFEIDFHNSSDESRPLTSSRRHLEDESKPPESNATERPSTAEKIAEKRLPKDKEQGEPSTEEENIKGFEERFPTFTKDLNNLQFSQPQLSKFDSKLAQNNTSSQNEEGDKQSRGRKYSLSQKSRQLYMNKSLKSMGSDEFSLNQTIIKKESNKFIRLQKCQPKHSSQKSLDKLECSLGQVDAFSQLLNSNKRKPSKINRANTNSQKRLFKAGQDPDKESSSSEQNLDNLMSQDDSMSGDFNYQRISSPNVHSQAVFNELFLEKKIETLQCQVNTNRIFLNMVIHDMRNPTNSIEYGVKKTLDLLTKFQAKTASIKTLEQDYSSKIELMVARLEDSLSALILSKFQPSGPEESPSPSMIMNDDESPLHQNGVRQPIDFDIPPAECDEFEGEAAIAHNLHSTDVSDKNVTKINPGHNEKIIHAQGKVIEVQKVVDRVIFTGARPSVATVDQAIQAQTDFIGPILFESKQIQTELVPAPYFGPFTSRRPSSRRRQASISISSLDEEPIQLSCTRLPREGHPLTEVRTMIRQLIEHELHGQFEQMKPLFQGLQSIRKTEQILQHSIFSASMLNNLINDLLDLAKLESNSFNFNEDYFNLVQTIDDAFNQVRFIANQKKIILKSTFKNLHAITSRNEVLHPVVKINNPEVTEEPSGSNSLLEPSPKVYQGKQPDQESMSVQSQREMKLLENIRGDSRRYLQIIMNFLSNALKFTSSEGTITVKLSLIEVQKKTEKEDRIKSQKILSQNDTTRSQTMKSIRHVQQRLSHKAIIKGQNSQNFDKLTDQQDSLLTSNENQQDDIFSKEFHSHEGHLSAEQTSSKKVSFQPHQVSSVAPMQEPPGLDDLQSPTNKTFNQSSSPDLSQEIMKDSILEDNGVSFIRIRIDVCDTGVGIKKENLSKLFMDFGRLDEHSKMNAQGTGLGLSICKRMVEQMGGTVSVDSNLGEGTTFTVEMFTKAQLSESRPDRILTPKSERSKKRNTDKKLVSTPPIGKLETIRESSMSDSSFTVSNITESEDGRRDSTASLLTLTHPLLQANLYPNQIDETEENSSSSEDLKLDSFTALIANDEDFQLMIVSNTLEQAGFSILKEACNGHEAYEFVQQSKKRKSIDLVLLDLNMPIMNGYDACRQIKSLYSSENKLFTVDKKSESKANDVKRSNSHSLLGEKKLWGGTSKAKSNFNQPQSPITPRSVLSLMEEQDSKPLFVAFSAHIDAQVEQDARKAGFDMVIGVPLTAAKIEQSIAPKLKQKRWRKAQITESQMAVQSPSYPSLSKSNSYQPKQVVDFSDALDSKDCLECRKGACYQHLLDKNFEEIKEVNESNELSSHNKSFTQGQGISRLSITSPCFGFGTESMKQALAAPPGLTKSEIKDLVSESDGDEKIYIMNSSMGSFNFD